MNLKKYQVFSSVNIEKKFMIKEFFDNYGGTLSHQDQTKIKKEFIERINDLQELNIIQKKYEIFKDGSIFSTNELTTQNISEGFVIFEVLELNSALINHII